MFISIVPVEMGGKWYTQSSLAGALALVKGEIRKQERAKNIIKQMEKDNGREDWFKRVFTVCG